MKKFMYSTVYAAICSLAVFIIGLFVPRSWFDPSNCLFREKKWEQGGKVYNKIKISKWKSKLPDMSKYVKRLLSKRLNGNDSVEDITNLLKETCVAEVAHIVLCVLSLGMFLVWEGEGGAICCLLYAIGNIPYIMIQRYNRPRLMKMLNRLERKEMIKERV